MSFSRPYEVYLRVFEPVFAHPAWESDAVSANDDEVREDLRAEADRRLLVLPPSPVPKATPGTRIYLPASETRDGITRAWPVQQEVLSWGALQELEENVPPALLDPLVPRGVRREAAIERMSWLREERGDRVFSQVSAWTVPFQWWLAFDDEEDEVVEDESEDGSLRVRVRCDLVRSSARVDWTRDMLAEKGVPSGASAVVGEFSEWLDGFDVNAVLELDLGGLSEVHWHGRMRHLVVECIAALAAGEDDEAGEIFARYLHQVEHLRLLARSN
ncbi:MULTISPECIES: hypothetical protein [Brevibacterium]|jgi:hypothetical protein|uniref:DUF8083 domain-containing protein n=1 Tax=Brevibacterium salitolerans TaxID=1403566 RepID=A0ABN2WS01_9MICO|nr:hypothetical protein [Brevibacterium sp.]